MNTQIKAKAKGSLLEQLKSGYLANVRQNLEIAAEWAGIEEEVGRNIQAAGEANEGRNR